MQSLGHAWLAAPRPGTGEGLVIRTENLRKYLARRRWLRCGQAIRAVTRLSSEGENELRSEKASLDLWKQTLLISPVTSSFHLNFGCIIQKSNKWWKRHIDTIAPIVLSLCAQVWWRGHIST